MLPLGDFPGVNDNGREHTHYNITRVSDTSTWVSYLICLLSRKSPGFAFDCTENVDILCQPSESARATGYFLRRHV